MNNQVPRSEEKVDGLLLPCDEQGECIVIYNINVPYDSFATRQQSIGILQRVRNLLQADFRDIPTSFQVTASYLLVNEATGQQRIWTGSFYAHGNVPGMLSQFKRFDPNTFVFFSLNCLEDIEDTLYHWPRAQGTDWKFDHVISIIFNVQCKTNLQSHITSKFRHQDRRNAITFALP
jgi:hypothetical protein